MIRGPRKTRRLWTTTSAQKPDTCDKEQRVFRMKELRVKIDKVEK